MALEGTGKYIWLLIGVFLIVYITVKISLGHLLKKAKEQSWKAYIPFYTTLVLTELLGLKKSVFFKSLIPFVNLYYYNIIIKKLLEGFGMDSNESILFVIFPMYKFPELVFKNPRFILNEYDLTEGFLETEKALNEKEEIQEIEPIIEPINNLNSETPSTLNNETPSVFEEIKPEDSVFTNQSLEPDETKTTYVEAKPEEPKQEKPLITPLDTGRPKQCPKCGATLAPSAKTCFLCGHNLGE